MYTAYLLLGSNIGDRKAHLQQAISFIKQYCGSMLQSSSVYQTAAWGITEQPAFYNQVIVIETLLEPTVLMKTLLEIEEQIGRKRTIKYGPRTIDIDILLIDQLVIQSPLLTVPHPFLPERRFALLPLSQVAPQLNHPVLMKSIQLLLTLCADQLEVHELAPE